jgi:hypothetical protein
MKEPESNARLTVLVAVLTAILVGLAGMNVARMRETARDSAHMVLWGEVNHQLKAREATGEFPASLEELSLTYPANGSPGMLKLFDYRLEGAGCRVWTTVRSQKFERRYGPDEG